MTKNRRNYSECNNFYDPKVMSGGWKNVKYITVVKKTEK